MEKTVRILMVEDNPDNANMMRRLLETENYEVAHSELGIKGVQMAREGNYDLILMDFNLPDIDGRNLVLVLRKQLNDEMPPIIAVTARASDQERFIAQRFGYAAFISKPFEPEMFLDTVRLVLKKQNLRKPAL